MAGHFFTQGLYLPGDGGQRFGVALFQFLDPVGQLLGDAFDFRLNAGLEGGEPFVLHDQGFDLGFGQFGVLLEYRLIQRFLCCFHGLFGFGLGIKQLFGLFEGGDLFRVGGQFQAGGDAGLGDLVLVVQGVAQQAVVAAVFLQIAFQRLGSAVQLGLQAVDLGLLFGKVAGDDQGGRDQVGLVLGFGDHQIGLLLEFLPLFGHQFAQYPARLPALLHQQVDVVLQAVGPVVHQDLINIVAIQQGHGLIGFQQVFTDLLNQLFGAVARSDLVQCRQFTPGGKRLQALFGKGPEFRVVEDGAFNLRRRYQTAAVALPIGSEQGMAQAGEHPPVGCQSVDIPVGDAALQVGAEVVQVFRFTAVDIAGNIQVVVVGGNFAYGHHAAVAGQLPLVGEDIDDLVDVLGAQAVFVAILHKALAGIDHKDALAGMSVFLVDNDDAGGNAGTVKQVGGQAVDALDVALLDQILTDAGFGVATEEHTVGQDHRALAGAFQAFDDVQQKGVVAVFLRRNAPHKAVERVFFRVEATGPVFLGKGRVGHGEVEGFQLAVSLLPLGVGKNVALPDLGGGIVVQNHIHARQSAGGVVHLLVEDRQPPRGLIAGFQQQGAGAAGGVVDGGILQNISIDTDHFRQNLRDLRRGVELALGFARFGGEVAHQVFIGITEQVVAIGAVGGQIQSFKDADQLGEAVDHLLALAELVFVIEVGHVDHALEVVLFGQAGDDLVDLVADLLVALERHHIVKTGPFGHQDHAVGIAFVFVRDILHKQQGQHIILVLAGIHTAAKLVAAGPEGRVKFGFLNGHGCSLQYRALARHD